VAFLKIQQLDHPDRTIHPKVTEAAIAFIAAMSQYDFAQRSFVEAIANEPVAVDERLVLKAGFATVQTQTAELGGLFRSSRGDSRTPTHL
jgi:hypothetical protein